MKEIINPEIEDKWLISYYDSTTKKPTDFIAGGSSLRDAMKGEQVSNAICRQHSRRAKNVPSFFSCTRQLHQLRSLSPQEDRTGPQNAMDTQMCTCCTIAF